MQKLKYKVSSHWSFGEGSLNQLGKLVHGKKLSATLPPVLNREEQQLTTCSEEGSVRQVQHHN